METYFTTRWHCCIKKVFEIYHFWNLAFNGSHFFCLKKSDIIVQRWIQRMKKMVKDVKNRQYLVINYLWLSSFCLPGLQIIITKDIPISAGIKYPSEDVAIENALAIYLPSLINMQMASFKFIKFLGQRCFWKFAKRGNKFSFSSHCRPMHF